MTRAAQSKQQNTANKTLGHTMAQKAAQPPLKLLPFLPEDNAATTPSKALTQANACLGDVLSQPFNTFVYRVFSEKSLIEFIDSFLRHRTRPYEAELKSVQKDSAAAGFTSDVITEPQVSSCLRLFVAQSAVEV